MSRFLVSSLRGNYDIVDAFDDLAPLILRERSFRRIDFGDWHTELLPDTS